MSAAGTSTKVVSDFRAVCGDGHVVEDPSQLQEYRIQGALPLVAVAPGSAEEVSAVLRLANEHGLGVFPAGGFTQQQVGSIPSEIEVLLLTTRLKKVEHYDPGDLTVGVEAGYTIAQLSNLVTADGLLLALDPPLPERCSVGGALATAKHGPLRHGYGGVRDFCLGIRFVTGDGRRAKGGGRVVKNVAGYDLMKLLIGSQGTLAVITSGSFKLFPAPRQTRTFLVEFGDADEALRFRDSVLRSPLSPMCLELVSPGAREVEGQSEVELWRAVVNFGEAVRARYPRALVVSLTTPLRDLRATVATLAKAAESNNLAMALIGRVGVGHLEVAMWPREDSQTWPDELAKAVTSMRKDLPGDTSMAVLSCPAGVQDRIHTWQTSPTDRTSMQAVKNAFDPKNVLNRGRIAF